MTPKYKFTYLPGFFQDYTEIAGQSPTRVVTRQLKLGILNRRYDDIDSISDTPLDLPQWARFAAYVGNLNQRCKTGESYKLLYLIRHGFGMHNMVMKEVGTDAWNVSPASLKLREHFAFLI
jgi:hypothetical protein